MKIRSILTLSAFAVLAVSNGAYAATAEAKVAPEKAEPAVKDDSAKSKLVLEKGLDAEAILKGYGKPYEIKPMKAPDKETKVEQWIYRRKVKETTTQTASGQTMVPTFTGFSGSGGAIVTEIAVPDYRLVHVTVYQVTELLMINGQLQAAKQWMGQEENHN